MRGPYFKGCSVHHLISDRRDRHTLFAAVNTGFWGSMIKTSMNLGKHWNDVKVNPSFPKDSGMKLEKIWHLEAGSETEPEAMFAGVEPAALFRSHDHGETWNPVPSLNSHSTRNQWSPGAGGLCLHSIQVHPSNIKKIYVGISAAGVFSSEDAGETWSPMNQGTRADFLPDKYPEVGQCVHKLILHPKNPSVLYQQNHCGVYRKAAGEKEWYDISEGLPSRFGFPIGAHTQDSKTIYVVPQESDTFHASPRGQLSVYRSTNGGDRWQRLQTGLPNRNAYVNVLREGFAVDELDPYGLYLGTNTGQIFYSSDEGLHWRLMCEYLPPIYSLETVVT